MVDKEKVEQRLTKLEQAVRKLHEIAVHSWDESWIPEKIIPMIIQKPLRSKGFSPYSP